MDSRLTSAMFSFWDDWLREPGIRRGRQIIRPEISRTYHFGNVDGASEGEGNNMLNKIELEESHAKFENLPLTSQLEGRAFAAEYWSRVSHARKVETAGEAKYYVMASHVRLTYNSMEIFRQLASQFDITEDEKAGVPRTGEGQSGASYRNRAENPSTANHQHTKESLRFDTERETTLFS